uniref:Uncharacterized protein n=1 Tax=Rhizophora mucronata TaxID=61149 RepID=A0A2P2Q116_RHIMU
MGCQASLFWEPECVFILSSMKGILRKVKYLNF